MHRQWLAIESAIDLVFEASEKVRLRPLLRSSEEGRSVVIHLSFYRP